MRFLLTLGISGLLLNLSAQNSDALQYRRLEGTIGKLTVVMHLHEASVPAGSIEQTGPLFSGVYYYTKYEAPVEFWGEAEKGGEIVLTEASNIDATPVLRLRRQANGRFTGTWNSSAKGGKKLAVDLRENYPVGSVRFTSGTLHDEKKMFPKRKESPMATVRVSWLEPAADVEKSLRNFLFDAVSHALIIDSINGQPCCASPRAAFEQLRQEQFRDYPGEMANDLNPDSLDMFFMYNNDYAVQTGVRYNDNQRLSLGFTTSLYTGGAHGNYGTDYYVYDLKQQRILQLADVIKSSQEKALEAALNRAARRRAGLKASDRIDSYYFVETMPLTENFYLTGKGIVFSYPPYAVASFADGQVELFVPFAEIPSSLKGN